jgi:hypothetical protein
MRKFDGNFHNYYISKYTNFIKIENKKTAVYNSLGGRVTFYEGALGSYHSRMKINNNETVQVLIKNKLIYKNEHEEKRLIEKIIKVSKKINNSKFKIHVFPNRKGDIGPNFFKDLERIINKNYNKSISMYIYIYNPINKTFLMELNDFFQKNNLEDKVIVFFTVNPLFFEKSGILSLNHINKKFIIVLIDENFFKEKIDFISYLEIAYQKVSIEKIDLTCAFLFNIKKSLLSLLEPFFSFFMKRGEMRFYVNFALNPVKESFCIYKDFGLFCEPDYDLFFRLLELICYSPKYNLIKIVGYGMIPKIQQYSFDKRYIRPSIDFCEWKSQTIYTGRTDSWTRCFKVTSENDFKNKFRLRSKCNDCSFLFSCGEGCKIKETINCPSFDNLFKILNKNIKKSVYL